MLRQSLFFKFLRQNKKNYNNEIDVLQFKKNYYNSKKHQLELNPAKKSKKKCFAPLVNEQSNRKEYAIHYF